MQTKRNLVKQFCLDPILTANSSSHHRQFNHIYPRFLGKSTRELRPILSFHFVCTQAVGVSFNLKDDESGTCRALPHLLVLFGELAIWVQQIQLFVRAHLRSGQVVPVLMQLHRKPSHLLRLLDFVIQLALAVVETEFA